MAIGVMSDEEFRAELERCKPRVRDVEVMPNGKGRNGIREVNGEVRNPYGRGEGTPNVPESLRKIIGETSVIDGRAEALDIAKDFGISPSSVSAYAKGATSTATYDNPVKSLIGHINKSRERAVKRASKTLNSALSSISQEKLDYADAKDLSGIAKDMSVIIKNLEPPQDTQDKTDQPRFVIFAPQFRDERTFETIEVKE